MHESEGEGSLWCVLCSIAWVSTWVWWCYSGLAWVHGGADPTHGQISMCMEPLVLTLLITVAGEYHSLCASPSRPHTYVACKVPTYILTYTPPPPPPWAVCTTIKPWSVHARCLVEGLAKHTVCTTCTKVIGYWVRFSHLCCMFVRTYICVYVYPHENKDNEWRVCIGWIGLLSMCLCAQLLLWVGPCVVCDCCRSQYKREMPRKKRSKPTLPPPSTARDTSSAAQPRMRMCNLCFGTTFVVLSMLLLTWNEVRMCIVCTLMCLWVLTIGQGWLCAYVCTYACKLSWMP